MLNTAVLEQIATDIVVKVSQVQSEVTEPLAGINHYIKEAEMRMLEQADLKPISTAKRDSIMSVLHSNKGDADQKLDAVAHKFVSALSI